MTVLMPQTLTRSSFALFGQVIFPDEDGAPFGPDDAQLNLSAGVPRFYAMRLAHRGRSFSHITRHERVTQCLGSMMGEAWLLAVAPPDASHPAPDPATLAAFAIPGGCFVKLHAGTWHAGPYFDAATMAFFNLELADTNIVDHQSADLGRSFVFG